MSNLDKKQQKIYDERAEKNKERLGKLKDDIIESKNWGNIATRLKSWHYDGDKDVTLTAPMIQAIKHNMMSVFFEAMTDTLLKKWNEETEEYAQFYFGDVESDSSRYITQIKIEGKDNPSELVEQKQTEVAEAEATALQENGIDVTADDLTIDTVKKDKEYKKQFTMTDVFNTLAEIDQIFYAYRGENKIKPTPKTLKMAFNLEITDYDVKEHKKAV